MSLSALFSGLRRVARLDINWKSKHYDAAEVKRLLEPGSAGEAERSAVLAVAELPGAWTSRLGPRQFWQLGRQAERLPTAVYLYAADVPLEEIGRRIGCRSAEGVEWVLDLACACIAEELNRPRLLGTRLTVEK